MDLKQLLKRLQDWACESEILPNPLDFDCAHYDKCNGSRGNKPRLRRSRTCLMSYVGREYGIRVAGTSLRILTVGMDHAAHGGEDYSKRREGAER